MDLGNNTQAFLLDLFNGEKAIAVFVVKGIHYYVFDDKINYCIDVRPEYKLYIEKGYIAESQYNEAIACFRRGISVLTEDNFQEYLTENNVAYYFVDDMRRFFTLDNERSYLVEFYNYIEKFLSTLDEPVSDEWDKWRMRLPHFYINFTKKIYRHTDWGRNHESLVPSGWDAQANSDFGLLVPDKEQYWLIDGMNFWKLQL